MSESTNRRAFNAEEKRQLYFRSGGRCSICRRKLGHDWHADHVEPFSSGGPTSVENGQALCPKCNLEKSGARANSLRRSSLPPRDGGWWSSRKKQKICCRECHAESEDAVTVMGYRSDLDPHGMEAERHPGWPVLGWLSLVECQNCGSQYYGKVISDAVVSRLAGEFGGWRREFD